MFPWRKLRDPNQERGDNRVFRAELTALVMADEQVREDGRRVCENNLLALAYVLGYTLITEEVHREAINFFPNFDNSVTVDTLASQGFKRRRTLLYPRNTYKSTLNMVFCVQSIMKFHMTISILILSGGKDLAHDFVMQVASFFYKPKYKNTSLFQALYPELCVEKEPSGGGFTAAIRQQEPAIIEPAIWSSSVEASTTGWHPDMLIIDDIHTNRNSRNYSMRLRITKSYKMARKILKPTGIELKIGTPYGVGDTFNDEVLNSKPGSYDRVYKPALRLRNGDRLDPNGFPSEDEVELLFPTILSYEFLHEEYSGDYETFMSQYMLDSYGASDIIFSEEEVLHAMVDEARLPLEGDVIMAARFPCTSMQWMTTTAAVGVLHEGRVYVVDVLQGRFKPSDLAKSLHAMARKHGVRSMRVEDSPGARTLDSVIGNYCLTTGWTLRIEWQEFEKDSAARDSRIRSIEALIATGRLKFSSGVKTKVLINGLIQYGMIDETGIPDVVARLADSLPASIASEYAGEDEDNGWEMMKQHDRHNFIYGRGVYAPAEPEPEEVVAEEEPRIEDQTVTSQGLEVIMPGLEF